MKEKIQELKRQHIIEVATKHFIKYGYEETKISVIAKEAGVSIGTIYDFFQNKEGIFKTTLFTIIENSIETFTQEIENITSPKEKLIHNVRYKFMVMEQFQNTAIEMIQATPWFFSKLMINDPFRKLEQVLSTVFQELNKTHKLRNQNYIQVARSFIYHIESYTMTSLIDQTQNTTDPIDVVEEFLQGAIQ